MDKTLEKEITGLLNTDVEKGFRLLMQHCGKAL